MSTPEAAADTTHREGHEVGDQDEEPFYVTQGCGPCGVVDEPSSQGSVYFDVE